MEFTPPGPQAPPRGHPPSPRSLTRVVGGIRGQGEVYKKSSYFFTFFRIFLILHDGLSDKNYYNGLLPASIYQLASLSALSDSELVQSPLLLDLL